MKKETIFSRKETVPSEKETVPIRKNCPLCFQKGQFLLFNYRTNFFITTTPPAINASDPATIMKIV